VRTIFIGIPYTLNVLPDKYKLRILDLAQKWLLDLLTGAERLELEIWFRALEDENLGVPTELSVDKMERRLHQLFNGPSERLDLGYGPPHPFR